MADCHLSFTLLTDGTFAVDIGGHVPPWTASQMGTFRSLLARMLSNVPPDMKVMALQLVVPVQSITVHLTPQEVNDLIDKATADLAYLGTQEMRAKYEGFEG